MVAPTPIVELRNICTTIGGQKIHRNIDLSVARGEVLGLIGGSGSGKTVLLREMIGLQAPSRGEVRVFGEPLVIDDLEYRRRQRARWGVLFQQGALFSALTVFDNIALPLREQRIFEQPVIRDLVRLKLAAVGLAPEDGQRMPAELSGGMVKRAALARALALEPELLLLDEPTAGLDPIVGRAFVELVRSLHKDLGLTVIMVTHDLETLTGLSDCIAVLAEQTLVASGSLESVMVSDHPFIREFFQGVWPTTAGSGR